MAEMSHTQLAATSVNLECKGRGEEQVGEGIGRMACLEGGSAASQGGGSISAQAAWKSRGYGKVEEHLSI